MTRGLSRFPYRPVCRRLLSWKQACDRCLGRLNRWESDHVCGFGEFLSCEEEEDIPRRNVVIRFSPFSSLLQLLSVSALSSTAVRVSEARAFWRGWF